MLGARDGEKGTTKNVPELVADVVLHVLLESWIGGGLVKLLVGQGRREEAGRAEEVDLSFRGSAHILVQAQVSWLSHRTDEAQGQDRESGYESEGERVSSHGRSDFVSGSLGLSQRGLSRRSVRKQYCLQTRRTTTEGRTNHFPFPYLTPC